MENFSEMYKENFNNVFAVCLRIVHKREDALDMTQNAFLLALQHFSEFRRESKCGTWLHVIAVHCCQNFLRGKGKRHRSEESLNGIDVGRGSHQDTIVAIHEALRRLKSHQREIVLLRHDLGYSHKEIAEHSNITLGSSRSHTHKAVVILRKKMWVDPQMSITIETKPSELRQRKYA